MDNIGNFHFKPSKLHSLLFIAILQLPLAAVAGIPSIDLSITLRTGAVRQVTDEGFLIQGTTSEADARKVRIRVGTSSGLSHENSVAVTEGRFSCRYPHDFPAAPPLAPMLCYIDATDKPGFGSEDLPNRQAEITLIITGGASALPDLPLVFSDDFIDAEGKKDQASAQWPRQRFLVNLFMRSRAACLMEIGRSSFDLATEADFTWFKENATLYDFDHRDRDWTQPLNHRVARSFWQAMWNGWFDSSNNHPWDGNAANPDPANYRPYTFNNDPANLLTLYRMMHGIKPVVADNRRALAHEVEANLLAMQHVAPANFAIKEPDGRQEYYSAGAFRYGMFETGEWLTEGTGWFANPKFRDFAQGGVFNGRAIWSLGEALKADPNAKNAGQVRSAIASALRYCLHEGLKHGYTLKTKSGLPIWNRTAGEHAYILLGMAAACQVAPEMPVKLGAKDSARPLRAITVDALDALAESAAPDGNWTKYANSTAMNIAALAEGSRTFAAHPHAPRWKSAAMKAADHWLALQSSAAQPTPMFGHMIEDCRMTFVLAEGKPPHIPLYVGGHWIHALAVLHAVTQKPRYAARAHAILSYYCGANPLRVRLLNELGAVNNRVTDTDHDGLVDHIAWNAYPESTAFVQIGLLHLLQGSALADKK